MEVGICQYAGQQNRMFPDYISCKYSMKDVHIKLRLLYLDSILLMSVI